MLFTLFEHSITIGIKYIKGLDFLENMKLLSFFLFDIMLLFIEVNTGN